MCGLARAASVHEAARKGRRPEARAFADEIIAADRELNGVRPDAWYDRLERDNDELQAALQLLSTTDPERGLELAAVVWPYWVARGRLVDGRTWLADLLAHTSSERRPGDRARALYGAGVIAFLQGDGEIARQRLDEALSDARSLGNAGLESDALISLARVAMLERDPPTMERQARESAQAALAAADERRYATALHHVAEALRRQARYDEALPIFHEAIELHRALGDRRSVALELHNLARLDRDTGRPLEAAERFRASLEVAAELKHERLVAYCLLGLATLAAAEGELARASRLVGAADARLAAVGAALEPEYADDRVETLRRADGELGADECARQREAGAALRLEESARLGLEGDGAQPL